MCITNLLSKLIIFVKQLFFLFILALVLGATYWQTSQQQNKEQKPLVVALQKQKDPADIETSANAIAAALSKRLARPVEVLIPGEYSATVQALISGHADVGYVSSVPFLLAERDGNATLLLAELRPDASGKMQTHYDAVLVARSDSQINNWEDVKKSVSDLRLVYTSHTSASGYVFPFAYFREHGLLTPKQRAEDVFREVQYGGGYTQALNQVLQGNADIAAVSGYTMEGENADIYLNEDARKRLKIIARIPGVPTHVIAARGGMPSKEREEITEALLSLAKEKPSLFRDVYGAASVVRTSRDVHVAATLNAIKLSDIPIQGLVK